MDEWAREQLQPWLDVRLKLPVGPLFRVINGPTRGRSWSSAAARADLRRVAAIAGVRRRFAPHQLRRATQARWLTRRAPRDPSCASRDSNLGITAVYLEGIDNAEKHRGRPRAPRAHDPGQRDAAAWIAAAADPLIAQGPSARRRRPPVNFAHHPPDDPIA